MADPHEPKNDLGELLGAVVRLAPVPMLFTDHRGRLLAANRRWLDMCGLQAPPADPDTWPDCVVPSSRERLRDEMERAGVSGSPATFDLEMDLPAGRRWSRWWLHRRQIDATPVLVMVTVDVHDDVTQRDDLRQLATRDDLTGVYNRRFFLDTVEQALRRAERFSEPVGLLYVDLDSFKKVNDRAGHAVGDRVLAAVAARLSQAVRDADVVGRIGGDEFAVLVERLNTPGELDIVARRVQEALNGSVVVAGRRWPISASVGVARSGAHHEPVSDLLARADEAMYKAKRDRAPAVTPEEAEADPSPADLPPPGPPGAGGEATPSEAPKRGVGARLTEAPRPGMGARLSEAPPAAARPGMGARLSEAPPAAGRPGIGARLSEAPPAAARPHPMPPALPTITADDLRRLREGMDTIRQSLESLLDGLNGRRP